VDWAFGEQIWRTDIPGKEWTCAVLGDKALDVIAIIAGPGTTTSRRNMPRRLQTLRGAGFTLFSAVRRLA